MTTISLEQIHDDLKNLQKDVAFIKHALAEDFKLSKHAESELALARKTPRSKYISQEEMEKEFSG